MNCFNNFLKSSLKSNIDFKKCFHKRKYPIDRNKANSLPIFEYPVAKSSDRRVYVFGLAETGALGIQQPVLSTRAKMKNKIKEAHYPLRLSFGEKHQVTNITCGYGFSAFAVKSTNNIKIFGTGLNTDSQLGYHAPRRLNPLEMLLAPAPIEISFKDPTTTNIVDISGGRAHLVIVTDNEGIFTLGNNAFGQCGRRIISNEEYASSMIIHKIESINDEKIIQAECGQDHSMFVTESGKVFACGWGADGQLGRGNYKTDYNIEKVEGDIVGEKIIKVSCTVDTVLALSDKGDVFGWGNTEYGQLNSDSDTIQQMNLSKYLKICQGIGKIVDIASGGSSCSVVNENGDVFTWGYGILGRGPEVEQSFIPLEIPSTLFGKNEFNPDSKIVSISSGVSHMAAITNNGDVYTWGKNKYGCLGLGKDKDQFFPMKTSIGAKAIKIACGVDHTVVLCKPFM